MLTNKPAFTSKHVKMWIENGIMHTSYTKDLVLTLEIAKEIVNDRIKYCEGKVYPGLADIRNLKKAEIPAMRYFASDESFACISKLAVYSDNVISKVFTNFWLKIDRPVKPTRYFTDQGSAYLYLKEINLN